MSDKKNFLGIPVEGDIRNGISRVEQRPVEDLEPLIRALLEDPEIVEFGWTQYTPYFADGDPCEFGVGTLRVVTQADVEPLENGDIEDYVLDLGENEHPSIGGGTKWTRDSGGKWVVVEMPILDQGRYDRVHALNSAVQNSAFEDVLHEAFGDHARVTFKGGQIEVDFYDHD